MPESIAAVGTFFAADAGTAAVVEADSVYAGSAISAGAPAATAAVPAATAAGGGLTGTLGTAVASAASSSLVGGLLQGKGPNVPPPITMPDPLAQQKATQKSLIEQLARRGRAASILTDSGSGKLGG